MASEEHEWHGGGYDRRTQRRPGSDIYSILSEILQREMDRAEASQNMLAARHAEEILAAIRVVLSFLRSGKNPLQSNPLAVSDAVHMLNEITGLVSAYPEVATAALQVVQAYEQRCDEVNLHGKTNQLGSGIRISHLP